MQKTLKSRTNDLTNTQTSEEYGQILILDIAKNVDDGEGKPITLTPTTYGDILKGLGYSETDRAYRLAQSVFTPDSNAKLKIYGEDVSVGPNASLQEVMAELEESGLATEHILLIVDTTEDSIKAGQAYTLPLRKIFIGKTSSILTTEIQALIKELNSKTTLVGSGVEEVQEDGLLAGFLGRNFPGSAVLSSLLFDGLQENVFSQTNENLLLGNAYGSIDSDGNGGINLPCVAEGEVKMLWGTTTAGKDISTEYFKNWLDDEIEFIGGRYISKVNTANKPLRGARGARELSNVLVTQVLKRAAINGAITGDSSNNPLGITFKDETGETRITTFTINLNGRKAEISYEILRETGIVAGDVAIDLYTGEAE